MTQPPLRTAVVLLLAAWVACGCGDGNGSGEAAGPIEGTYVGQEIWISYGPAKRGENVLRTGRAQDEARALAADLHRQVVAGADIGELAMEHSNAQGGAGRGYTGPLPVDRAQPTARDRAIASVAIGELTPVVEWFEGYWFARRVDMATGRALEEAWLRAARLRARFRVIALLYRGAWIPDAEAREKVKRTRPQAVAIADSMLKQLRAGVPFEELARRVSEDSLSAENGGIATVMNPDKTKTEWIRRQDPRFPRSVLEAVFTTPVGEVHPEVIVSPRGVFVVKLEGLKEVRQ